MTDFYDRHHRKPRSIGGGKEKENISILPRKHHEAWHLLFQNWTAEQIAKEINAHYLDPEFKFILKRR